jgi:hypothetical protein
MSIGQIIALAAVIGAFVVFAVVLAWGDYHAQQLTRRIRDRDQKQTVPTPSGLNTQKSAVVRPVPEPARWPQGADDRLQHIA